MNENKIFIEGTAGFKPAVMEKLSGAWLAGSTDGQNLISISISEDMKLDDLQDVIGKDIISDYELQFRSDLTGQWKYVPGGPVKMTIWTNSDSKLGEKKTRDTGNKFMSKLRS
jgi:hypothetical protein